MFHHTLGRKIFTNHSTILLTRGKCSNSVNNILRETTCSSDVDPPLKRHRDSLSVLRALNSCVRPVPEAPDFRLGGDPWLSSVVRSRAHLLAKAKGRLAAKIAARDFFPNDIAGVAKEIPRVDRWLPLQKPDDILNRVTEGSLTNHEAMDRLILLLAPKHAWKLYSEIAPDEKWTSEILHNLLDLLCATNSGISSDFGTHNFLNDNGWSDLPEPDELYFTDELNAHFKARQTNVDQQINIEKNKLSNQKQNNAKQSQLQQEQIEELKLDKTKQEYDENVQNDLDNFDIDLNSYGWQLNGPAEQLFLKEKNLFHNSNAYSSMIRGASKYRNPNRALELVKLVWSTTTTTPTTKLSSSSKEINLDLITYSSLIRSLHNLKTVESDNEDVWSIIENILKHVSKSDSYTENVSLFRNILYCLAEITVKNRKSFFDGTNQLKSVPNYVPIGLGLLDELRCLNLKPDLGVMANLLRLIHNTVIPANIPPTSTTNDTGSTCSANIQESSLTEIRNRTYSYSCRIILESFLSELENDFNLTNPTRFNKPFNCENYWSQDDYTFFPTAMRIAWYEHNSQLGDRINKLLVGDYDRRFLLGTSLNRRNYGQYYCLLMLNRISDDFENPSGMIERFHNLYESNRDVILTNDNIIARLMTNYANFLNQTINLEKSPYKNKNLSETRQIAYSYLCGLLSDLIDKFQQSVGLPNTKSLTDLIKVLTEHSYLNPEKSVQISAKILSRLKLIDERINMENSKLQTSDTKINRLDQKCFKPSMIENMIKLTFSSDQVNLDQSILHKKLLTDTINDWFNYALIHKLISWSWTPKALSILWECDSLFQCEDIWKIIEELGQAPIDPDNQSVNSDLLNPILNELEHILPMNDLSPFDNQGQQRTEHLRIVRSKLLLITDDSKIDNSTEDPTQSKQLKSGKLYNKESTLNIESEQTSSSESDSDSDSDK